MCVCFDFDRNFMCLIKANLYPAKTILDHFAFDSTDLAVAELVLLCLLVLCSRTFKPIWTAHSIAFRTPFAKALCCRFCRFFMDIRWFYRRCMYVHVCGYARYFVARLGPNFLLFFLWPTVFNSHNINILAILYFRGMIFDWLPGIFNCMAMMMVMAVNEPLEPVVRSTSIFWASLCLCAGCIEFNQPAVCVFLLLPTWREVLKSYQFAAPSFQRSFSLSVSVSRSLSSTWFSWVHFRLVQTHSVGFRWLFMLFYLYLVHELRLVFVWVRCSHFLWLVLWNFPREILISVFFAPFDSSVGAKHFYFHTHGILLAIFCGGEGAPRPNKKKTQNNQKKRSKLKWERKKKWKYFMYVL